MKFFTSLFVLFITVISLVWCNCFVNDVYAQYDIYIKNNVKEGFFAAVQTTLTNCTSTFNGGHGILATKETRIEGNNLRYNGQDSTGYGIFLNSDHNYVLKNSASDNESGKFFDVQSGTPGANYMPICGVDATDNCNYQF